MESAYLNTMPVSVESLRADATEAPVTTLGRLAVRLHPDDWHWELVDADREPVATGRVTHDSREAVESAVSDLQASAAETTVYEIRDAAFDCYRSESGWTWRLVDADHEPLARASATYDDRAAVQSAVERVSALAPDADVVDYDDVAFELRSAADGWTWRLVDEDGEELARSIATFESRVEAQEDLSTVKSLGPDAWVSTAE
ncbi:YegP family protein [Halosimplex rubrum]|uniref:YegP family protein n=1 Tax=Halosimplex rubrum TaxID=869889 RepID=A0A7D5TM52_9EURY|nr:YegP family protein [Halosimplex rubrum]QLH76354.1 YegP family protein [Halosimplex rubrum]